MVFFAQKARMNRKLMVLSGVVLITTATVLGFSFFMGTPTSYEPQSIHQNLIPFGHITLTLYDSQGHVKAYRQTDNKIVDNGLKESLDQLFGNQLVATSYTTTGATMKYLGVGTGTSAASASDVDLQIPRSSKITGSVSACSGICGQVEGTFVAGKLANSSSTTVAITEAGLFDTNVNGSSNSNLFARQVFSAITMGVADSLKVTWQVSMNSVN